MHTNSCLRAPIHCQNVYKSTEERMRIATSACTGTTVEPHMHNRAAHLESLQCFGSIHFMGDGAASQYLFQGVALMNAKSCRVIRGKSMVGAPVRIASKNQRERVMKQPTLLAAEEGFTNLASQESVSDHPPHPMISQCNVGGTSQLPLLSNKLVCGLEPAHSPP